MSKRHVPDTPRAVARYSVEHADRAPSTSAPTHDAEAARMEPEPADPGRPTAQQLGYIVEVTIQQAMRRGDFDNLPGAGKPLEDLGSVNDPDWWIRRKIQREGLTGFGPPALTLRTEDAGLDERLDALAAESAVRRTLEEFNHRVREARRQLLGGPPVVTRLRDVDAEVAAWRARAEARRALRLREAEEERQREAAALAAMTWRERWRAKRRR